MGEKTRKTETPAASRSWLWQIAIKALVVGAAVVALVVVGMMPEPDRTVAPSEAPSVNVAVMQVVVEPGFADSFILPAVVEPNQGVTISAEVAARVERIGPEEGDRIKAGDLLIGLNDELIRPQSDSAEAQVKRDEIQFNRMEELVKENATSRQDLDNAITDLAASKAQLAEVRARLDRTHIYTPLTGVLNVLLVEEGEYVQAGTPVAELVDMVVVKVVVDVPERDIMFFAVGQEAEVLVRCEDGEQWTKGAITYINELADQQTRSTSMELVLDNSDRTLRSGQIVRIRLTRRILNDAMLIPLLAVLPQEEGYAVYVVEDGKAKRRDIEIGIIKGHRVQITRGLEPGEKLIIEGHRLVASDQKVNVVPGNQ